MYHKRMDIYNTILAAGGPAVVSRRLGIRMQRLGHWRYRGIPDAQVINWCRAVEWRVTPHQVAPHLYPHPLDGMPTER